MDESDRINELLKKQNKQVDNLHDADFIVVTTCAVSKDSANNSAGNILHLDKLSGHKPIYVGGCLPNAKERDLLYGKSNIKFFTADEIFSKIEGVSKVCNQTTVRCDPFWLKDIDKKKQKLQILKTKSKRLAELYAFSTDGIIFSEMPFDFDTIRISKGCNKHCSYCAIPHNRGKYLEHGFKYIKKQIDSSRSKYLLLIGENTGCHKNFEEIIEYAIMDNKRLMLRYLEPEYVNRIKDEFLKNLTYIGVPIQSASLKVLKDMRRPANLRLIKDKFKHWHKQGIFLGTSIILSYPTEKFMDYIKTLWFVLSVPVNYVSFQNFSPRENSPSFERHKDYDTNTLKIKTKYWLFDIIVKIKLKMAYWKAALMG
ncbi:MAG: radical SAM protein [Candidatus Woesearchaeota archaeon]